VTADMLRGFLVGHAVKEWRPLTQREAAVSAAADSDLIAELRRRAIRYNETGRSAQTERMLQALGVAGPDNT
jgi:hypothetical protein